MESGFQETRWTLLANARHSDSAVRKKALDEICAMYWKPLYGFLRRKGHSPEDAADLVQGFLAKLLADEHLNQADPDKGRLRNYLLTRLRHFANDQRKKKTAQKRGGGALPVSIHSEAGEAFLAEASSSQFRDETETFDREWARTIWSHSLERLGAEQAERGKLERFQHLRPRLFGDIDAPMSDLAAALDVEAGALRVALHRLRERLRELLTEEVAQTLGPEDSLEAELRYLAKMLSQ